MFTTPLPPQKRLSTQTEAIAKNITAIRSLDWDRDRFDIEFGLQNGTTYNSYLIQADKVALVDSSHEKFRQLYLDLLQGLIDPQRIDYLIVSHTEPDHSGLVKDILQLNPRITVVATKVALQFLDNFVHQPFERIQVKSGDRLDLGQGHDLEFVSAPNLHWPDTMLTYDPATEILFTCDVFGMHYCSDAVFDIDLGKIAPDYQFYYDCLMGPNARSVLAAMKRMDNLGTISTVANGHGPLLRHNVGELLHRYRHWSESQSKAEKTVVVFYVADYGYGDRLSQAIAKGITKTGVGVDMVDLSSADPQEIQELVGHASGVVLGMPPLQANADLSTNFGAVLAAMQPKQVFGLYESYGGDDEPIDPLRTKFLDLGLREAFKVIKVKDTPSESTYQLCDESGTDLGQNLIQAAKIKQLKSLDSDLEKAIGRISGGLYIITAQKGEVKGAMLASWVSQASFNPPGFTVAVAKDRAIESLMQVGDRFVLNILEEGNYQILMKHFLKRFPPGADRFAGVKTQTASNGSPILTDALAYLECEVASRMECSDHWIVYSQVTNGRVAKAEGLTAVHHRKVGNYY
ncbi:flavoprotein [Synechocystis sp. PCC 6803]|uniref:Diflavin flavoprotein A 1 n=1 Tax=Synechocystis sp. (strain ATCC 27184 / PCC 6803 / Kazusa) TaxID=1111708 RepID=DFA1_SYNY3|nr:MULTISPECIES: diflavin flavoprotein [unclassified Synechocystis]Q55393.1 RecName: Full=Diflavin flavoprotein A 1; AltName: Full=NADH:oxygen oxidoreductase; AltName: Full=SsATF573 [Synechocystis sp. PCC 6803 substr. Kazusa]AGF52775.1 flavoprotein [Synechocystis sp. PCC 6803]ALJ68688.1 diflavin flavoprotein A [Synechocystis sp. PCC 6803]AVP90541.1 diflavin flavoprotein A [Synechocystis sp. IPPAS B-1465]MBD2616708.1 flavin reductase [Synechocystis sp. FACHB-898]MBD2638022.1 flavin reductase [